MGNTITLRGKIKDGKMIELQSDVLNKWKNQEVVIIIKKDKKFSSTAKKMLDEMKIGKNIGYTRLKREEIYRV